MSVFHGEVLQRSGGGRGRGRGKGSLEIGGSNASHCGAADPGIDLGAAEAKAADPSGEPAEPCEYSAD